MIKGNKFQAMLLADGVVENFLLKGVNLDVDDVIEIKQVNMHLAENKPYCVLVSGDEFITISKEAKVMVASEKFAHNTIAKAIVVDNLSKKLIVSFYLAVNKPKINTKSFLKRNDALNWLLEKQKEFY